MPKTTQLRMPVLLHGREFSTVCFQLAPCRYPMRKNDESVRHPNGVCRLELQTQPSPLLASADEILFDRTFSHFSHTITTNYKHRKKVQNCQVLLSRLTDDFLRPLNIYHSSVRSVSHHFPTDSTDRCTDRYFIISVSQIYSISNGLYTWLTVLTDKSNPIREASDFLSELSIFG